MKKIAAAACISVLSSPALAGGYPDLNVEPPVIVQDATASSAPSAMTVLLLTTLVVFGAAASQ